MAEQRAQRRLAAILAVDVVGYSRLMEADEAGTLNRLKALRAEFLHPKVAEYGGRIVKTTGDGTLVEFPSAVDAIQHAVEVQADMARRNSGEPEAKRIVLRMGINLGDIIIDGDDIYGDGVNVAARLEGLANPGGICISGAVYDHVQGKIEVGFEDLGPQMVKNIARPIQVLRVRPKDKSEDVANVSAPVPGFQGRPAIAVLPLQNLSGDPEQEYFADGIAEDILTRLAMWRWCPIIARNSSFAYKGKNVDIRQIGKELGAHYVLEGSMRKAGDRVRITGQLIEAETGHHVWAERYDRNLEDIFDLQDEIVNALTAALEPAVGRAEIQRAQLKPPASLDAWGHYHRGLGSLDQFTREGFSQARASFARSIALDSNFAPPRAWSASMSNWEAMFGWENDPQAKLREAIKEAESAVASDPADALGHAALCIINAHARQYEVGLSEGRQAIEINPSFALGHFSLGIALMMASQPEEAVESMSRAMRLSVNEPLMFTWYSALCMAHYTARDYEQAAKVGRLAVQKAPQYPNGQRGLAISLAQIGETDEAQATFRRFLELAPGFSVEALRYSAPFREPKDFEHLVDGLRKAGWRG